jgi:hypothetical protein
MLVSDLEATQRKPETTEESLKDSWIKREATVRFEFVDFVLVVVVFLVGLREVFETLRGADLVVVFFVDFMFVFFICVIHEHCSSIST